MGSFLSEIEDGLNDEQLAAVCHEEGPLLILAGAGSGKTRVLTCRIARLVRDAGFSLDEILAMTFSNKAAREMHDRVKALLGDQSLARYPWISTFHSVGVKLLRRYSNLIGISNSFAIYDSSDQLQIVKQCFTDLNVQGKSQTPKNVHARISQWKNEGILPEHLEASLKSTGDRFASQIYKHYQELMKKAQALDFDDLLLCSVKLLSDRPEIRAALQAQWRHILVDEFQDTNRIQYKFLQLIIGEDRNVCVVGDDDQSIYGWRGAKIENILNFDKEFKGARVIKLERNYRSTGNILKAAGAVISKNEFRHDKTLWTSTGDGAKIKTAILRDDRKEAGFVVGEIKKLLRKGVPAKELAVLYRVNSVSRVFEEECLRQRLPYKIVGGFRFYERKEIKDVLSYLKLFLNSSDSIAFKRSVNTPARGIGKVSIEKIELVAGMEPIADYLVANQKSLPVTGKAKKGLEAYVDFLKWGRDTLQSEASLVDLVVGVIENTGYLKELQKDMSEESRDRQSNLQELLSAIQEFEEHWAKEGAAVTEGADESVPEIRRKLFDFLERVALISDVDQLDELADEQITFMSIHAAKGLEFQACFIAAMEDGLFPSVRSLDTPDGLEEERRLCYVGMTRAKEYLYLTRAESRRTFGSVNFQIPSRFLKEIPIDVLESYVDDSEDFSYSASRFQSRKPKKKYDEFSQDSGFEESFSQEFNNFNYHHGDRVQHPSFGAGVVKKVELLGEDECLTIDFKARGRKRVLSQFVQKAS